MDNESRFRLVLPLFRLDENLVVEVPIIDYAVRDCFVFSALYVLLTVSHCEFKFVLLHCFYMDTEGA